MECRRCHGANATDARFCFACGASLEPTCPRCGAAVQAGAKFCQQCGTALSVAAVAVGATASEPVAPSIPAESAFGFTPASPAA
jgi:hypothetical protein